MRPIEKLVALFLVAQLLGIYTGLMVLQDVTKNPYVTSLMVTTNTEEPLNAVLMMGYILFGAAAMIIIIRKFAFQNILKIMEFMLISTSSSIVIYAFLRLGIGYDASTLISIGLALILAGVKVFMPAPELKNIAAVLATAGVGTIFGISLGIVPLVLFLILLSIYDYISVFATKHMVEMANFIIKKDMAFTITARGPPMKMGEKEQRIDLGTGDMIAPVMMDVALLAYHPTLIPFTLVGSVLSLWLFLNFVWKKKMVLPALPPIVLGMIISLAIGFLAEV